MTNETDARPPRPRPAEAVAGAAEADLSDDFATIEAYLRLATVQVRAAAKMADAISRNTTEVSDAVKWFAAFSTAGLLALSQLLRVHGDALIPLGQEIGLIVAALGFLTALLAAGLFILTVELRIARWLRSLNVFMETQQAAVATVTTNQDESGRASRRGDHAVALATFKDAHAAVTAIRDDLKNAPKTPRLNVWMDVLVFFSVGGFLIGLFGAVADFAVKMAAAR